MARLRFPRLRHPRLTLSFLLVVLALLAATALYQTMLKPLPAGLSFAGPPRPATDVRFLRDITRPGPDGPRHDQQIYDEALALIAQADDFILADLFLFNDFLGRESRPFRPLSREVAAALIARKKARPALRVVVITDPVNEAYGGADAAPLRDLREAGIPVVLTDLTRLRDSNPAWSAFWRLALKPFGTSPGGLLPHPFSPAAPRIGFRSWFTLLNFKANHRKILVADTPRRSGPGRELAALVMSANPHDGSSAHGNVALALRGPIAADLVASEQAVLDFSAPHSIRLDPPAGLLAPADPTAAVTTRLLTEQQIRAQLLADLDATTPADAIDIAMFYLADRRVVAALKSAAARGVPIRLILDQNRDAFGFAKDGIPNKPVAAELHAAPGAIGIRWYDTRGEQFHSKLVLIRHADSATLFAGSANLTRRNLGDYNLESDLRLSGPSAAPALAAARDYFEDLWSGRSGPCTLPYESAADPSRFRFWKYRIQEATGLGTF